MLKYYKLIFKMQTISNNLKYKNIFHAINKNC